MTAVRERTVRTPPRFAIRTFWLLHRALYRFSGGRFGLSRPEAGERFGMMRLNTLGRRSGEARAAIIGYYEDDPNLVTLAMNGWGRAEPAWWLNLQANPDATVDLVHGPRAVRARAVTGEEGQRLWTKVRDYPGWGGDIDASAAQRSTPTAVVVFEPRGAGSVVVATAMIGPSRSVDADRPRRLALRHLWLIPGLGLAVFANAQSTTLHAGLVPLLVFGIVPHLTLAVGIGQPHARGQLAPRAVPLFHAIHQPVVPLAVLGLVATGVLPPFWLVGAFAWLSHIVVDWGFDNGLRTTHGYRRGPSGSKRQPIRGESGPTVPLDGSPKTTATTSSVAARLAIGGRLASTTVHNSLEPGSPTGHAPGHRVRQIGRLDNPSRGDCGGRGVLARPTGVGSALTAYDMPIEGRDEWVAAVARLFA